MTTTYTITAGTHPNSLEIYFEGKPAVKVRDALKALRYRWNPAKACWYGFASESATVAALQKFSENGETWDGEQVDGATVYTDGYLGGGAVYGSKSRKHLYGADLSKAIREDIKAAGIKGVSVKCKSYSGGQSITATVTTSAADFVSLESYIDNYTISYSQAWIQLQNDCIHVDKYFSLDSAEQEQIRQDAAAYEYERLVNHETRLNEFYLDKCAQFTPEALDRIQRIQSIIAAYRYDESNSMVDYFDTNFYYDIYTKPAKA